MQVQYLYFVICQCEACSNSLAILPTDLGPLVNPMVTASSTTQIPQWPRLKQQHHVAVTLLSCRGITSFELPSDYCDAFLCAPLR